MSVARNSLATSTIIAIVVAFVAGIIGIVTASFCFIRSRRRRRRREETARRVAVEAKKEYDEKLPRVTGTASQVNFTQAQDFSTSGCDSPISPFGDEQRVGYDTAFEVLNDNSDAASINMENGRAMSMGRQHKASHGTSGGRGPSRARTLDPRSRHGNRPVVRELDSDRASARGQTIRTLPIREGDITPYTLPPMPTSTSYSLPPALSLRIPPAAARNGSLQRPIPPISEWRRPSDEETVDTLATDDDDAFAEDGSSLARTLTTESGESGTFPATHGMFRSQHGHDEVGDRSFSPVAWGPGPFGDEHQGSGFDSVERLAQHGDFDDTSTIGDGDDIAPSLPLSVNTAALRGIAQTPTLVSGQTTSSSSSRGQPSTYLSTDPFADPSTSSIFQRPRFPPAPQSEAGRSEVSSGAMTEASFMPGDDARSDVLNLGSRWRNGSRTAAASTRNGIAVTYLEDLDSEDDQTTPSDTVHRLAPRIRPGVAVSGDSASSFDEDEYIRTLEGAISCGRTTDEGREVLQLPPSYNEVFGNL